MNQKVAIVGGGTLSEKWLSEIKKSDVIVGVDRGAFWLLSHGVVPHIAIGDFDSVTQEEFLRIKKHVTDIHQQPPHPKYETDMELAVEYAIRQKPSDIAIYGGVGTRMDHTVVTMHLLDGVEKKGIKGVIVDEYNTIRLIGRGRTILERGKYSYVSLLPYSKKIIVSLKGFKYEINNVTIRQGQTLGISNEFAASEATIDLHSGKTLVIESND